MSIYKKPVHELCVDKTDCQHEVVMDQKGMETKEGEVGWKPSNKDRLKNYDQKDITTSN